MARRKTTPKASITDVVEATAKALEAPIEGVSEEHLKAHASRIIAINSTVNRLDKQAQSLMLEVAFRLGEIKDGQWFLADGFKTINDFGSKVLGYKSSMTSKCVQASKRLENHLTSDGAYSVRSIFALYESDDSDTPIADFGLTQLFELASTPDDEITKALTNGVITHDMSCSKLRNFAKSLKSGGSDAKELTDGNSDKFTSDASNNNNVDNGNTDSTSVSDVRSADNAANVKNATKTDYMRTFKDMDNDQLLLIVKCALSTLRKRGYNPNKVASEVITGEAKPDKDAKTDTDSDSEVKSI